jgi:thiamine-phosphate diphosphorylase
VSPEPTPSPFPSALRLVYVVDLPAAADGARIDRILASGVTCLWLRAPEATARTLYDAAGALVLRCRRLGAALLVGDRVDVALAVGADGVELGARAAPARAVRPWYRGWMGVSCHGEAEIRAARDAGADHVVLSPVFGVPDKGAPLGVERLSGLVADAGLPVVALGGIDEENVAAVRATGVAGVAVIRALRDAPEPAIAARRLASLDAMTAR